MTETRQFSCRQLTVFYAMVLVLSGEADPALLASLGLDAAELTMRLEQGGPEADAARLMLLGGHTGSRRILALMLRGALLDRLTSVEKAAELRDLATAMARMPAWVFDEAGPIQPSTTPAADHNPVGAGHSPRPVGGAGCRACDPQRDAATTASEGGTSGAGCQPADIYPVGAGQSPRPSVPEAVPPQAGSAAFQAASGEERPPARSAGLPPTAGLSARSADFQSASPQPYPIETRHTPAAEVPAADYSETTCEKGRGTTAGEDRGDGTGGQDYSFTFDDSLPDDADPGPG